MRIGKDKKEEGILWLAFIGLFLVGLGVGMLYGKINEGTIIGLGAGFLAVLALHLK